MARTFTVEQANRTLPLIKRIVRDIVEAHAAWQKVLQEFEVAAAQSRADQPWPRAEELQHEAQRLAREIQGFMSEVSELGVEFKGFELGLVDFPCEMNGRIVYLCWKLGEDSVQYWHETNAGYDGRQPLEPAFQRL